MLTPTNYIKWLLPLLLLRPIVTETRESVGHFPPTINAELSVEVPDNIELNKPFEVRFFFETLEELRIDPDKPHRASLIHPPNAVYIKGDTVWTGNLLLSEQRSIAATFELVRPGPCRFIGHLVTVGVTKGDGNLWYPDSSRFVEHRNGINSRIIQFPESEKRKVPMLLVTDSGLVVTESKLPPLPAIIYRGEITIATDSSWDEQVLRPALYPRELPPSTDTNYINLDVASLSTVDEITLLWPAVNIIVFSDATGVSLDANKMFINMKVDSNSFHIMPIRKPSTIIITTSDGEITLQVLLIESESF